MTARKKYIDSQGREDTQGLIDKSLLLDTDQINKRMADACAKDISHTKKLSENEK